jgi:predicted amidohydrolase YtcJ
VHDERGEPNGILRNATSLLKNTEPAETFTREEKLTALEAMLKLLAIIHYDGDALSRVMPMKDFFPLRSYLNAGIHPVAGSDQMIGHDKNGAVNPYNPLFSMWMMLTRRTPSGAFIEPGQRVTREEALKMHTIWAAEMQFADDVRGSIETGKLERPRCCRPGLSTLYRG